MLLSKLGEDVRSDSSTRGDSRSPATQRTRLPVPKENISHPGKLLSHFHLLHYKVFVDVNYLRILKGNENFFGISETSDITSVCSLSASAGAEAEYINLQNQNER